MTFCAIEDSLCFMVKQMFAMIVKEFYSILDIQSKFRKLTSCYYKLEIPFSNLSLFQLLFSTKKHIGNLS